MQTRVVSGGQLNFRLTPASFCHDHTLMRISFHCLRTTLRIESEKYTQLITKLRIMNGNCVLE